MCYLQHKKGTIYNTEDDAIYNRGVICNTEGVTYNTEDSVGYNIKESVIYSTEESVILNREGVIYNGDEGVIYNTKKVLFTIQKRC